MPAQLKVKRLHPDAVLPTVAYAGDDLGFDLYALADTFLPTNQHVAVHTGVALEMEGFGFRIADRGSMARFNITVSGGVMDAYRDEWQPRLTYHGMCTENETLTFGVANGDGYWIKRGEKIAQAIPQRVYTGVPIVEVAELSPSARGTKRFGSSGR